MKRIGLGDTEAARLRARLGHPVIDADGHVIETPPVFMPFFEDYVRDIAGGDMVKRFRAVGGMDFDDMVLRPWSALSWEDRRRVWATRPSWWSLPAANSLDRATSHGRSRGSPRPCEPGSARACTRARMRDWHH